MPSYFNSEEAIKVFFMKDTKTAEHKKMYQKLLRIWSRAVRVGGTKGGFYYQRSCSSIKGKPILIFEPQGAVDRGIFQEISKIGETLEGRFICTKNGYIELHVHQELNESNLLKYARSIRKIIASISGIMAGGNDDRVTIITPKVKARMAKEKQLEKQRIREKKKEEARLKKEQAEEKKRQKEERRKAADELREENKRKRAERAAKKAQKAEAKKKSKQKEDVEGQDEVKKKRKKSSENEKQQTKKKRKKSSEKEAPEMNQEKPSKKRKKLDKKKRDPKKRKKSSEKGNKKSSKKRKKTKKKK